MHVFERQPVRKQRVVGGAGGVGDVSGEEVQRPGSGTGGTDPIDAVDRVVGHVVQTNPFAGIGQGYGTAIFQAPFTGRAHGTIHAARTGRGPHHNAGFGLVKAVWHLDCNHHLLAAGAVVQHGDTFTPWDQPFVGRDHPSSSDVGAIQAAVAAINARIQNAAVVGKNGVAAQFQRGGVQWVGIRRCGGSPQPGAAHTRREQVLRGSRGPSANSNCRVHRGAQLFDACGQVVGRIIAAPTTPRNHHTDKRRGGYRQHFFLLQLRCHHDSCFGLAQSVYLFTRHADVSGGFPDTPKRQAKKHRRHNPLHPQKKGRTHGVRPFLVNPPFTAG